MDRDAPNVVENAVGVYKKRYGELSSAVSAYFMERLEAERGTAMNIERDWLAGLKQTVYGLPNDEFSKQIEQNTGDLKAALKRYVK